MHGRVQGVGFRYFAQKMATTLGVGGSVRNRADGSVEVYAVGSEAQLDKLATQLRRGPSMARVDRVEERKATAVETWEFRIEY